MKYMGSKNRIAKEILPIILKDRKENQTYIEPFVGGGNIIDKVDGNRVGGDINPYLIELFNGLKTDRDLILEIPKSLYDECRIEYNNKTQNKYDMFTIAWVGYMGSANGRFFEGGYSGTSETKIGTRRDYIKESINNILKQKDVLKDVVFINCNYDNLDIPKNSIVYCDPPYQNTKSYSYSKNFDYEKFWQWCRDITKLGNRVFISEYNAPSDFKTIWEKEMKSSLKSNNKISGFKTSVEKLFIYDC